VPQNETSINKKKDCRSKSKSKKHGTIFGNIKSFLKDKGRFTGQL